MSDEIIRLLSEQVQLAREQVRLARVQVQPVAREVLRQVFFDGGEPHRDRVRIYANLDGSAQRVVAERAGVTQPTVSRWSNEWKRLGIVDEDGVAVFNIYDFYPELEG